jgi:hypothetical protein
MYKHNLKLRSKPATLWQSYSLIRRQTMAAQPEPLRTFAFNDSDSQETREWMDALSAVIATEGPERAHFLLEQLLEHARENSIDMPFSANTGYVNTIEPDQEDRCPGNIEIEERLRAYMRWNAMAMVVKANRHNPADGGDLGGHIGSFASLAHMFGAGFNHFWHAENENHGGDLLYIQGHVSPGVYARAYLEGRLTEEQLLNFRQEVDGKGLSSYPHPKLMPEFWQFPTVSMGLGPFDGDLPSAVFEILARPWHCQHREPQGVGVLRRRRDGRGRVLGRHWFGRTREAGQPDLCHQLQLATLGRPGARQRQDHPRAGG